jgi:hypothetical protein
MEGENFGKIRAVCVRMKPIMELYNPQKNRPLEGRRREEKKPDKESPEEEGGMSRRDFLKLGALALGGAYVEKKYGWMSRLLGYGRQLTEEGIIGREGESEKDAAGEDFFGEGDNYPENLHAVTDKLKINNWQAAKIDGETSLETEGYWYRAYAGGNRKLEQSLEYGYLAMQRLMPQLRKIFEEEFRDLYPGGAVPEETINLLYLAIPESHWNWKNDSPKGAAGPYQFMLWTGKKFGLKIETVYKTDWKGKRVPVGKIDERLDELKSARAAARCLKDLFKRTGDWELALSGYNGGFIWKYLKEPGKHSYPGFLKFIENKVNYYKKELPKSNFWKHKIEKGQTLEGIARFYRTDPKIIAGANRDRISAVKAIKGKGNAVYKIKEHAQVLLIPALTESQKQHVYECLVAGFVENLNYPPRYNAVVKIIMENDFQKKMAEKMKRRTILAKK